MIHSIPRVNIKYKVRLTISVYKQKRLVYRNDMLIPTDYKRRSECREYIKSEIKNRLHHSNFFISPRVDYDLVRYTQEASYNTYLRYRIIEEKEKTKHTNTLASKRL